jgi:cytochrome b561
MGLPLQTWEGTEMAEKQSTYNRTSQIFHWVSTLIIIGLAVMGTIMVRIDNPALQDRMYSGHVTFGLLISVITIGRIVWLFAGSRPSALKMPRWEQLAFLWNHRLLYVIIVAMVFSGIAMLLLSGTGLNPGNVSPDLIQDVPPRQGHNIFSKVFIALFVMHVGGVFYYQFTKGDTLGRMGINWLSRSRTSR